MTVSIVQGTNDKPVASRELVRLLGESEGLSGHLFVGYPIIGTAEGAHRIDALFVSEDTGLVVLDLIEGTDIDDYSLRQDDSANKLEARLKTHRDLMERRSLLIPIHTISFAPALTSVQKHHNTGYALTNSSSLLREIESLEWMSSSESIYRTTLSVLQSISTIRRSRAKRSVKLDDSRGARLKRLEDSIATLDNLQGKAVIETVEGVQRIRGLAGSGKTIVLALKAAYFHAQHPDWRIAVTFNTRSLKGQFQRLITSFSLEQTSEEPDWENLRVVNAWGAPGAPTRDGIYHEFCRAHGIQYLDFQSARAEFGRGREFAGVCDRAISEAREKQPLYNVILVDEAQDFPPAFLRLCYEMLDDTKRLVYAYDELQNLGEEALPSPERIFGKKADGSPRVNFNSANSLGPRQDIILEKCYRNSRPVLVTAHALGFGIYREPAKNSNTGLVQMFDQPQLWEEIGYRVQGGELTDGSWVVLHRPEETSPRFLEDHSSVDDLVEFRLFKDAEAQADWLVDAIEVNLRDEELRHDDIVVINPDPLTTRKKLGPIRRRLLEGGIRSHLAGVDTDPDIFFQPGLDSITFTGIYRAKGNEAGMVYIVNAQDCHSGALNLASIRNRLFTAITRSAAWVRVLGIGSGMERLMEEYRKLKARDFRLEFLYPDQATRERLRIVHRDVAPEERRRLRTGQKHLIDLINSIESGKLRIDDIDERLKGKLRDLLEGE